MMVERLSYQLEQILADDIVPNSIISVGENDANQEEERRKYKSLYEKINISDCIEFMLMLENQFNGFVGVINEYLLSLQIEIDLRVCLSDPKGYEEEKNEKKALIDFNSIITAEIIEMKLLKKLQSNNSYLNFEFDMESGNQSVNHSFNNDIEENSILPKYENDTIVPLNPSAEINKEIESIRNRSFGYFD